MASTINAKNTSTGVVITPDSSGQLELQTADTTRMTIDVNGNVGVGTSSPANKFNVVSSATTIMLMQGNNSGTNILSPSTSGSAIYLQNSNTTANTFSGIYSVDAGGNGTSGLAFINNNDANNEGTMAFITRPSGGSLTERMRIDSSGNVVVGTTSGSAKINTFVNSSQVGYYQNKPSTGNADHQQFYTDGTLFAKMTNRGSWYNFDNVYGSLSDATLKENISNATPKLNDLMQVEIRNFNFIADENKTKQLGVIAQELEAVFPSMVDSDENGIKSVKYSVFIPMLIKSIQELKTIIDTQAERIAVLENKIV